jgi:hypothetical protein
LDGRSIEAIVARRAIHVVFEIHLSRWKILGYTHPRWAWMTAPAKRMKRSEVPFDTRMP